MDPNKYKKNANIKPESLARTLISVSSLILMLIGIAGIALEIFKDDGLFGKAFSYLFQSTQHMLLIPVILIALWLINNFISTPDQGETKRSGNLPMYLMVLLGAYFVFRFVTTGSFS